MKRFFPAILALVSFAAPAQAWPTKPMRLVVPFAPGGSSSIVARAVGAEMEKRLGQPIVIDNRPGGGDNVAAVIRRLSEEAARAVKQPSVLERFAADDAEGVGSTPEEYASFIAAEQARWSEVVRKAGIKAK